MTDEPRKMIFVGVSPSVGMTLVRPGHEDPITVMVREANARLDRERADAERKRLAVIADAARLANTRRARAARRLNRALRAFGIGRLSR